VFDQASKVEPLTPESIAHRRRELSVRWNRQIPKPYRRISLWGWSSNTPLFPELSTDSDSTAKENRDATIALPNNRRDHAITVW